MIAIPTFTAFVTAVILQPVRSLAITLALLALALAGTFYFRHRAEQGAAKWWYVVSYRFRSGLSGFATPDRLVFPALDLSVPWHTVNAVTTVPEGFVLSVGPVLLPIHQSMFEATDDWEHFQALVIRAMEERST